MVRFIEDEGVKKSIEMTRLLNEALGQRSLAEQSGSADGTAEEETAES
jgi:hypothetical protein